MDSDVIEQLFIKYYHDILLYSMSLTKDASQAEDLAQEAFYKALKSANDSIANFKAWALTVCRNMFLNKKRKYARIVELDENMSDERDEVLAKIVKDEKYRALYNAIGLLADNLKEVILLFYFENLKIDEISVMLDKSESNVKVMLFRGREQIRKILEK